MCLSCASILTAYVFKIDLNLKLIQRMHFEVKNLSCSRGNRHLFRNLNICLPAGKLLFITGSNGAGKSSLLKILAGLISPEKGYVTWCERNIKHESSWYHANMSYLGHKDSLKKALTPYENITHQLSVGEGTDSKTEIKSLLTMLELQQFAHTSCQQLSAGQRRKVALAALMLKKRPLWILDEPFTALDATSVSTVKTCFQQHTAQGGMIIMASHSLDPAEEVINLSELKC